MIDNNTKKRGGGPKTPEGKARSARNATRHGLTGDTIVLSNENQAQFEELHQSYIRDFQPETDAESDLVGEMAAARWRLQRAWLMESAMFELSMDRTEQALEAEFEEADEACRLATAFTHMANEKGFNLLGRYETRIARRYDKALATLRTLQKDRRKAAEGNCETNSAAFDERCQTNSSAAERSETNSKPKPADMEKNQTNSTAKPANVENRQTNSPAPSKNGLQVILSDDDFDKLNRMLQFPGEKDSRRS
jgi:hypothetical protein